MKKTIVSAVFIAALTAGAALAADLPSLKAPPPPPLPPPPMFSWTGFYAGLNIGGGWFDRPNGFPVGFRVGNTSGVVGGGQIGYNWQWNWLVIGVETDFQGTSLGGAPDNVNLLFWPGPLVGFLTPPRIEWFGTVRGRVGVAPFDPHFLIYGTGGFAYGEVKRAFFDDPINGFGEGRVDTGWTAGGGIEWAFMPNWSAKVEYLYTQLERDGTRYVNFLGPERFRTKFNTVRAGVNYHFNFGAPAPVLAKF